MNFVGLVNPLDGLQSCINHGTEPWLLHVPYLWDSCGIAGNNQEYFHHLIISIFMVNQWFLHGMFCHVGIGGVR